MHLQIYDNMTADMNIRVLLVSFDW